MTLIAYAGKDGADKPFSNRVSNRLFSDAWQEQIKQDRARQAKEELRRQGLVSLRRNGMPEWARQIVDKCANKHGVFVSDIASPNRRAKVVAARNEAIYLIKSAKLMLSGPQIAKWFAKDHTTIFYALASYSTSERMPMLTGYDIEASREQSRQSHYKRRAV